MPVPKPNKLAIVLATMTAALAISSSNATAQGKVTVTFVRQFDPLPVPSDEALQADLDRETDPKAKNMKLADLVDLSVLREIEKSGFLVELYGKGAGAR